MEIERKWLIREVKDIPFNLDEKCRSKSYIKQAYFMLNNSAEGRVRYRKTSTRDAEDKINNVVVFKSAKKELSRKEYDVEIDSQMANFLFGISGKAIEKERYVADFPFNGKELCYEFDFFKNEYDGLILCEIEFDSVNDANTFNAPQEWIGVTGNPDFYNANMFERMQNV